TFSSENFVESIYAWIMLTGIPVLVWRSGIKIFSLDTYRKNPSLTFFLLNGILLLGVMFLSNWVYVNGVGRRYFSIVYVFLWMAFLLLLDTEWPLQKRSEAVGARSRKTDLFQLALIFMILIGGFSSFDKFYFPKRIPPRIDVLSDFQRLGNIGIIGEYWNSYLIAAVDPVHIKATPYDKDMVRNRELAREVFRQPKMYIVRDGWLDSFPDTLMQFDHYILKKGEEVRLGDCYICRYAPDLLFMQFTWREMQHQGTVEDDSLASGKQSIRIGAGFDRKKHFIYGPFIKLDPGMISVTFRLKAADCLSTNNIAVLDVTANYGKKTLASKTLRACDFEKANYYQDFEIPMELDSTYHGLEFRVLYLGPADLWFDKVFIKGRI
ncbi:MAG TPA: hypothetical protein VMC08_06790, partial [Bacteroidales bacterium]|nr:hypothetical protein [Bacteroidales bacterium]